MAKKHKVMKLWMMLLCVFGALVGIVGVTVLILYASGQFNQKTVLPQNMAFVKEVDENIGFFDDQTNTFNVSSDFSLMVSSTTENITNDKVTLSFSSMGGNSNADKDGKISNGVIRVPKTIQLNKPFTVQLVKEDDGSVAGGNVTLYAISANNQLGRENIHIAVDVPVQDIQLSVVDSENVSAADEVEVIVGTKFTLQTLFTPANSKFKYSNAAEQKLVFFNYPTSASGVDFVQSTNDSITFSALSVTGAQTVNVTAYTFVNSTLQRNFLSSFYAINPSANDEVLRTNAIAYLSSTPEACVTTTVKVKVVDVEVDTVAFTSLGDVKITADTYFRLTANSSSGDATLGAEITDTQGEKQSALFSNLAIKVPQGAKDFKILGGNVMKVVKDADGKTTITREDYSDEKDYSSAGENTEYYILANNTPTQYGNYYWDFTSPTAYEKDGEDDNSLTLGINFFFQDDDGVWQMFFTGKTSQNEERTFGAQVSISENEYPPSWNSWQEALRQELVYDSQGNLQNKTIDLSDFLGEIRADNVYKKVVYFLFTTDTAFDVKEHFSVGDSQTYSDLSISPLTVKDFAFYEIADGLLTIKNAYNSLEVYLVAAVVRTDVYGNIKYVNKNGINYYDLAGVSTAKQLLVSSELSMINMQPYFTVHENIKPEKVNGVDKYFVPVATTYFDNAGMEADMISFTIELAMKNSDDDVKLLKAYQNNKLFVQCFVAGGTEPVSFLSLDSLSKDTNLSTTEKAIFVGKVSINNKMFIDNRNLLQQEVSLKLFYSDEKNSTPKTVCLYDSKANEITSVESVVLYYPTPAKVTANFLELSVTDDVVDQEIQVVRDSNSTKITWNGKPYTISELNEYLACTILDAHDRAINPDLYDFKFVEQDLGANGFINPSTSYIGIGADQKTLAEPFRSTGGDTKTTYLSIQVVDKRANDKIVQTLPHIKFSISSVGVSAVRMDVSTSTEDAAVYEESPSVASATVNKYVTMNSEITLKDLIQVDTFTKDPETNEKVLTQNVNLIFKLSESYATTLKNNEALRMMFESFNDQTDITQITSEIEITKVKFAAPFFQKHAMTFVVTDENSTFKAITLVLNLLPDVSSSYNFKSYADTVVNNFRYSQFLSQKEENVPSVFADETYDLNTYLSLISVSKGNIQWNNTTIKYNTSDDNRWSINENDAKLILNAAYECFSLSFVLYYGKQSTFAYHITVTLNVVPNVIVVSSGAAFVNLLDIRDDNFAAKLNDMYKFYKVTDYVKSNNPAALEQIKWQNLGLTLSYNSPSDAFAYLSLSSDGTFSVKSTTALSLNLGETFTQSFVVKVGEYVLQAAMLDAQQNISPYGNETILDVSVGFGQDQTSTVESMFKGKVNKQNSNDEVLSYLPITSVQCEVNEQMKTFLILTSTLSTAKYELTDAFKFVRSSSSILKSDDHSFLVKTINVAFSTDEYLTIQRSITTTTANNFTATLTVSVTVPCIISVVGEIFVNYDENSSGNNEFIYADSQTGAQKFVSFDKLISSEKNGQILADNDVYQTLDAGQTVRILNDSNISEVIFAEGQSFDENCIYYEVRSKMLVQTTDTIPEIDKVYYVREKGVGFFFNSTVTGVSHTIDIVSCTYGSGTTLTGLASIINEDGVATNAGKYLKINSVADKFGDIYIVLRITISRSGNNLTWFYRVKVQPNFTAGRVVYPYDEANECEFLSTVSQYYTAGIGYEINLDETFSFDNSKFISGSRFESPTSESISLSSKLSENFSYVVRSASGALLNASNYISSCNFVFVEGKGMIMQLALKNYSSAFQLVVTRTYFDENGDMAVGSELLYTFAFNLGQVYSHSIKNAATDASVQQSGDNYSLTLPADGQTTNLKVTINTSNESIKLYPQLLGDASMWVCDDPNAERPFYTLSIKDGGSEILSATFGGAAGDYALSFTTADTVTKDYNFVLQFYTAQKVAFKLLITIKGNFTWILNSVSGDGVGQMTVSGGKTYGFVGTNGIFRDIASNDSTVQIDKISLELTQKSAETKYMGDFTFADLVKVDNVDSLISFAHVTNVAKPLEFEFEVTITAHKGDQTFSYSFFVTLIERTASFINSTYSFSDSAEYISGNEISIDCSTIISDAKWTDADKFSFAGENNATITAEIVGVRTIDIKQILKLSYVFEGKTLFTVDVEYKYISNPNVTIETHSPMPDAENEISEIIDVDNSLISVKTEYLAASQSTETFGGGDVFVARAIAFNSSNALFANNNRIEVFAVEGALVTSQDWTISIQDISNLSISTSAEPFTEAGSVIYSSFETSTSASFDLTFTLADNETSGWALLKIVVNKVVAYYKVYVVKDSVVTVRSNVPNANSAGGIETIYAEDLFGKSLEIFKDKQILKYTLLASAMNETYFAEFSDGTDSVRFEINATSESMIVDLGQAYAGFEYAGTYSSKTSTQKLDDSEIFKVVPYLTGRLEAVYADGKTTVKQNESLFFATVSEDGSFTPFNTKTLATESINETQIFADIAFVQTYKQEDATVANILSSKATYSVKFMLDFQIENNANKVRNSDGTVSLPKAVNIDARGVIQQNPPTLFNYAADFGIKRTRANASGVLEEYNTQILAKSGATIDVKTYGFSATPIVENVDSLTDSAYALHNNLRTTTRDGVIYHTGLAPRAATSAGEMIEVGNTVSISNTDDNSYNYLVIARRADGDWTLTAQGANNDGNFVMLRVTYTISLGRDEENNPRNASVTYNILFKVVPNSSILYYNFSNNAVPAKDVIYNNRTYSTNTTPLAVTNNDFTDETIQNLSLTIFGSEKPYIDATLYGNSIKNKAGSFNYTYTPATQIPDDNIPTTYNNWSVVTDWLNSAGGTYWTKSADGKSYTISSADAISKGVNITFTETLDWGTRNFFIEFSNLFGFKGRFFFTLTSTNNPQVKSLNSFTLTEGSDIAFGAAFREVAMGSDAKTFQFDTFTYQKVPDTDSEYKNSIKFETSDNLTISKAIITATLTTGEVVEKTVEGIGNDPIEIFKKTDGDAGNEQDRNWTDLSTGDAYQFGSSNPKPYLTRGRLENATIVLKLLFNENSEFGTVTATYGSDGNMQPLTVTYKDRTNGQIDYKVYKEDNTDISSQQPRVQVALEGINAYGFSKNLGAVDINSISDFFSDINKLKVYKVDFTRDGKEIGTTGGDNAESYSLITNSTYYFFESDGDNIKWTSGNKVTKGITDEIGFRVPYLDGVHFGTNNRVSGVSMVITMIGALESATGTVVDNNQYVYFNTDQKTIVNLEDGTTISDAKFRAVKFTLKPVTVTIQRDLSVNSDAINIADNTSAIKKLPELKSEIRDGAEITSSGDILNDTLEVSLKPTERVSFVISNVNAQFVVSGDDVAGGSSLEAYLFDKAQTFVAGKTYFNKPSDDSKYVQYNGDHFESGVEYFELKKIENILELENATCTDESRNIQPYDVTEYVSISQNISNLAEMLDEQSKFNVFVLSHTLNGSEITTNVFKYHTKLSDSGDVALGFVAEDENRNMIGQLSNSALVLHINSADELVGGVKVKALYYLVKYTPASPYDLVKGTYFYQHTQNYNIYPTYTSATHDPTSQDGSITVNDYIIAHNDQTGKEYYVVTLNQWANRVTLENKNVDSVDSVQLGSKASEYYMFSFSISSSGGAASIDEHGMITTDSEQVFDRGDQIIFVSIYMKVSGADGKFEDKIFETAEKSVLLKEVVLRLEARPYTDCLEHKIGDAAGGTYTVSSGSSDLGIMTIPVGFQAYYITNPVSVTEVSQTNNQYQTTLSGTVGQVFDFRTIFDDETILVNSTEFNLSSLTNKNYHLVSITQGEQTRFISYNNLNSFKFEDSGKYLLTFVASCKGEYSTICFTANIIVFNDRAAKDTLDIHLSTNGDVISSTDILERLGESGSDLSIWEVSPNGTSKIMETYSSNESGIYSKFYVITNVDGRIIRYVQVNFFVYESNEDVYQSVAMHPGTTFNLENLLKSTDEVKYEFYLDFKVISSVRYADVANKTVNFYVLETRQEGGATVSKLIPYHVFFKGILNNNEQSQVYLSADVAGTDGQGYFSGSMIQTYLKGLVGEFDFFGDNVTGVKDEEKALTRKSGNFTIQEYKDGLLVPVTDIPAKFGTYSFVVSYYIGVTYKQVLGLREFSAGVTYYEFDEEQGQYVVTTDIQPQSDKTYYTCDESQTGIFTRIFTVKIYEFVAAVGNGGISSDGQVYDVSTNNLGQKEYDFTYNTSANLSFSVAANLGVTVRSIVGVNEYRATTFYVYDETMGDLVKVDRVNLEFDLPQTKYCVKIGSEYYLFNITLKVSAKAEIDVNQNVGTSLQLSSLQSEICNQLGMFKENTDMTAIDGKTYYIYQNGKYIPKTFDVSAGEDFEQNETYFVEADIYSFELSTGEIVSEIVREKDQPYVILNVRFSAHGNAYSVRVNFVGSETVTLISTLISGFVDAETFESGFGIYQKVMFVRTTDTAPNLATTYYIYQGSKYVEKTFSEGENFRSDVIYFVMEEFDANVSSNFEFRQVGSNENLGTLVAGNTYFVKYFADENQYKFTVVD